MVELMTIIHNGGLVMGLIAIAICFALIAYWPEKFARGSGGFRNKPYDQEHVHEWVVVDPEWFVAGKDGGYEVTTLSRCRTCLEYDKETGYEV